MKEQKNSIDQLFQEQLADYELDPPMHLLDGILGEKDKKRGLWWWNKGALALLLFVAVGGSLLLNQLVPLEQPTPKVAIQEKNNVNTALVAKTENDAKSFIHNKSTQEQPQVINSVTNSFPAKAKPFAIVNKKVVSKSTQMIREDETTIAPASSEALITPDFSEAHLPIEKTPVLSSKAGFIPSIATVDYALVYHSKVPSVLQKTDCSHFGKLYSGIYAELSASLDGAQRRFSPEDEVYDSYLEAREAAEQQGYAYSLGFHLTALSKSGISITTGVDYHQIGEKFIYQDGFKTITLIEKIYDDNDMLIRIDTVSKTVPNILSSNNKYQLTQMPLLLGYELNAADFTMGVYAGAILNVLFRQEVKFLSPDDLEVKDYSNNTTVFRKNLGLGWRVGVGFGYRVNGRHIITIQPYVQSNPKSFTQDDFPLRQKYFITGIRLGWKTKIR